MAGTLTISTLSDGTNSTSATNCIQGSAKAWVQFNGSTGVIRSSYNTSSVTRDATGNYTVNLTNAMTDTNYATVATGGNAPGDGSGNAIFCIANPITTSTVNVHTRNAPNSDSDYPSVSLAVFR